MERIKASREMMKSRAKRAVAYGRVRMSQFTRSTQNTVDVKHSEDTRITLRAHSALLPSVFGLLALSTPASAQEIASGQTVLAAVVSEQATLELPTRASALSLPSGSKVTGSAVRVTSHVGKDDSRSF